MSTQCLNMIVYILTMVYAQEFLLQGHRFVIIEGFGCRPSVYTSITTLLLVSVPPLILCLITLAASGKFSVINSFQTHAFMTSRGLPVALSHPELWIP